jgi:Tfp pilus assembly protein PilF
MNVQHILLSAVISVYSITALASNDSPLAVTAKAMSSSVSTSHTTDGLAAESTAAIDKKPFWSPEQKQQAALEKAYKNIITENTEDKQAYIDLAGLYLINNKTSTAIDAYQDAITHDPENPKLFAAISIAYLHQSKYAMARAMADEALRLDPSMQQVNKINEYIEAKEAAIQAAANVSLEEAHNPGVTLGEAPNDVMHGSRESVLRVDKPSEWTKPH